VPFRFREASLNSLKTPGAAMNHQSRVYDKVFEMLPSEGNPSLLVRINGLNPSAEFTLYGKLEHQGVDPMKETFAYCRIGERSSHAWFVLKYLLGLDNVKNYDGSWTEYGNLVGAPIEK
jgi:rhodanese-related sulfurtransferase